MSPKSGEEQNFITIIMNRPPGTEGTSFYSNQSTISITFRFSKFCLILSTFPNRFFTSSMALYNSCLRSTSSNKFVVGGSILFYHPHKIALYFNEFIAL